ncbi:hypothetical protein [Limnobacter sp.]|uniref:hypothetical protein n=1 Tax=Limnobacter sp. TaxID=2003368 RepID=UPI00258746C0|nr:hypothetical protein [Limnobacter sp.]HEX5486591.1 hypothetical protein [Limnobacter sp.]
MKASLIKSAAITLLIGASVPAFACAPTDPTCNSSTDVTVNFGSSYQLDPNHAGIYLQNNTGDNAALGDLQHVVITNNGNVDISTAAVGNSIQVNLQNASGDLALNHVNQVNSGDQVAKTVLGTAGNTTGEISLSTTAVGNNFSVTAENTSLNLSSLSVNQCNTGNMTANTQYFWDPTKLAVNTSAIGNAVSITVK